MIKHQNQLRVYWQNKNFNSECVGKIKTRVCWQNKKLNEMNKDCYLEMKIYYLTIPKLKDFIYINWGIWQIH